MFKLKRGARLICCSAAGVLLSLPGCTSDNGGIISPRPPLQHVTITGVPAKDSALQQLGLILTVQPDSTLSGETCIVLIDGTSAYSGGCGPGAFTISVPLLTPGAHKAEFAFSGTTVATLLDTTFTFTSVAPKLDPYSLTLLPPLPGDSSAFANDMNESGIVVGQSVAPSGTSRAVTWVAGQPSALPHQNIEYGSASSVNAAGAIAGLLGPSDSAMVVWTTNDSIITVTDSDPPVRINDAGQVLTQEWSHAALPHTGFLIYDLSSGLSTVITPADIPRLLDFNNKGQVLGFNPISESNDGRPAPYEYGGVSIPTAPISSGERFTSWDPRDLTDSSKVLIGIDGWLVFGTAASSVVLNPFFGGTGGTRANNNDVVAGIGPDSAIYLWRKSANVSERVDAGAGWTFDAVRKLNDNGAILAHGQNATTGQSGSVVLTPIS